jgi:hypothetical protein
MIKNVSRGVFFGQEEEEEEEGDEYKTTVTVRRGRRSRTPFTNSKTHKK